MSLFKDEGHYITINPEIKAIKEFDELIKRDKGSQGDAQGRKKQQAMRELAYVYHMCDPLSPFSVYEDDVKEKKIKKSFDLQDWKPDKKVQAAIEKYKELNDTQSTKLLRSARKSVDNLRLFFESVDLQERDENGKPVHDASKLVNNLTNLGKVVQGLKDLEDQVEAERQGQGKIKGDKKINKYSE